MMSAVCRPHAKRKKKEEKKHGKNVRRRELHNSPPVARRITIQWKRCNHKMHQTTTRNEKPNITNSIQLMLRSAPNLFNSEFSNAAPHSSIQIKLELNKIIETHTATHTIQGIR